jgi:hypothetical protein
MIFAAMIAAVVTLFMLRKSSAVKRHVLAFLAAAVLSGIVTFATFEMNHSYLGYTDAARFNASMDSFGAWILGLFSGFILGGVAAKLFRPKAKVPSA